MKKLILTDYKVEMLNPKGQIENVNYGFRDSFVEIIMSRILQLNGTKLLESGKIAAKVKDCKEDYLLLEDSEWKLCDWAIDTYKGLGKAELELVKRIKEAPDVEVAEKK